MGAPVFVAGGALLVGAGGRFFFMPLHWAGAGKCARRRSNFLLLRQKKVTKEKATPLSASPALRCGATCGAHERGALRNSLRAYGAPLRQPQRVSSRSACVLRHTRHPARCAPQRIQRGWGADIHSGHCFARPRFTGAGASRCADRVERSDDPCGCLGIRLFGYPPPVAAPASGRLRGGMGVEAPMLRDLTRCGCLSGAATQRSEFRSAPRNRPDAGLPRSKAKGSQTWGRPFFGDFLSATRKKVTAPPGALPGSRPMQRHAAKSTHKPRLRQAQPERAAALHAETINFIAACAYSTSARAQKYLKTQRPAP
ncbi:hypothetical protein CLU86_0903 [Acidovorax sp. 62]|nr:hypothetical protein CLU86_0903 [Acidovorax sp. 62]